jgi:THO complex subunit 7
MEYDALAAIIQTQPDRKITQEKLSLLWQVLEASECECQKLEARLKQRRKQFHLDSFQLSKEYSNFSTMMKHPNCLFNMHPYSLFLNNNANKYKSFETQKICVWINYPNNTYPTRNATEECFKKHHQFFFRGRIDGLQHFPPIPRHTWQSK